MDLLCYFRLMGAYNAWANSRLFATAAALSDIQYEADRGAFFKSVHGTLNHLLVTDRIWMHRFTGTGDLPSRLDEILFDNRTLLHEARVVEDCRILEFVDGLDDTALARMLRYKRASTPEVVEQRLAPALAHVFNHQTHHRGQIHALMTGLTGEAPSLDLLAYQRLQESSASR